MGEETKVMSEEDIAREAWVTKSILAVDKDIDYYKGNISYVMVSGIDPKGLADLCYGLENAGYSVETLEASRYGHLALDYFVVRRNPVNEQES